MPIISVIILNLNTILEGLGNFGKIFDDAITKPTHFSSIARLGKSYNYLGNLTGMQKYFGCGIGNEYTFLGVTSVYINSMARLIIQSGYIGVILFGAFLIQVFKECKSYIEYFLLILYITKCVSGGAMFSIPGIFILLILKMSNFNSINKKVEVNEHD